MKTKKKNKDRKQSQESQSTNQEINRQMRKYTGTSALLSGVVFILFGINIYFYKDDLVKIFPEYLRYAIIVLVFFSTWKLILSLRAFKIKKPTSLSGVESLKGFYFLQYSISVIILGFFLFPIIYFSGVPSKISNYFIFLLPFLTNWMETIIRVITGILSLISGALGNVALGILGNFIYDLIKIRWSKNKEKMENKHGTRYR